jgi:outer membrane protein assembly factor BamB
VIWPLLLLAFVDWPQFRGPEALGVSEGHKLPTEFNAKKNVVWQVPLPPGHSSPIVVGKRIFVTAVEGEKLLTIALSTETGKELWRQESPRPRKESFQKTNTAASPSPASDGQRVFSFFGDFGLLAYTVEGKPLWQMPLGPFNNPNGHGSSPIVADGTVVLICDQDTNSYLLAADAKTGKVRYKIERPEVTRGYGVPALYKPKTGPVEMIIPGAYITVAYNFATGEKLWWFGGMSWQSKSPPILIDGIMYQSSWETGGDGPMPEVPQFDEIQAAHDKDNNGKLDATEALAYGIKAGGFTAADLDHDGFIDSREWGFYRMLKQTRNALVAAKPGGRGDVSNSHVLWRYSKSLPNTSAPLHYNGALWIVKDGGVLTTLNPKTGEVIKQGRLTGALEQYWASPVAGDGKVYMISAAGKVVVLKGAGEWEILAMNELDDEVFATPAIVNGRIYLRTRNSLYCFAQL